MSDYANEASTELGLADYNRCRLDPRPADADYLHLSDLRLALGEVLASQSFARVLDYGCGGSPYRPLIKSARYDRADIPGVAGLDFVFGADSKVEAPSAAYDCVLSTQVLEHVPNVSAYLAECHRALRPGGALILTTHGTFGDHGCPYDFRRWTADGLIADLRSAGFEIESMRKLTTGGRAIAYLTSTFYHQLVAEHGASTLPGLLFRIGGLFYTRLGRATRHRFLDLAHPTRRVVAADVPSHELYIALLAVARRASPS